MTRILFVLGEIDIVIGVVASVASIVAYAYGHAPSFAGPQAAFIGALLILLAKRIEHQL